MCTPIYLSGPPGTKLEYTYIHAHIYAQPDSLLQYPPLLFKPGGVKIVKNGPIFCEKPQKVSTFSATKLTLKMGRGFEVQVAHLQSNQIWVPQQIYINYQNLLLINMIPNTDYTAY